MAVMSILSFHDLGLRPSLLKAVQKKARHQGQTAAQYIRSLVERELLAEKTFDEILKPIRDDFRKSGVTEEQLDEIVNRARAQGRRKTRRMRR